MRVFGLIGYPLGHSSSGAFFSEKFRNEGHDAIYKNFELSSLSSLPGIITANKDLEGLNVTIPFKSEILHLLDEIDPLSEEIGAVNVIKIIRNKDAVLLKGYNTDVVGFTKSIKPVLRSNRGPALVLGTGGSSLAVRSGLKSLGIEYKTVSRTKERGDLEYAELNKKILGSYPLIINASPLGMFPEIAGYPDIPYEFLTKNHILFDLVYNPELTTFLSFGSERACTIKSGLEMLHIQAEEAWAIWNTRD